MKTVLLLRHAKSDRDNPDLPDIQRPLTHRGYRDSERIGKALRKQGVLPDLIRCSPAVRTGLTLDAVMEAAHLGAKRKEVDSLYAASSQQIKDVVRALPDTGVCALLVGHNPSMETMVALWTGSPHPMPTAALACIVFDVERWKDVPDAQGKLAWLLTPADLDDDTDSKE